MTKGKLPAFLFYPGDFLGSTAEMSPVVVGHYIRLLCYNWINGSIPKDNIAITQLLHISITELSVIWPQLVDKFVEIGGRLTNKRLEAVRKEALEYRENRSKSGKIGMEHRWKTGHNTVKDLLITNGITKHNLSSSSSSSLSSLSSISKESKRSPTAPFSPPLVDEVIKYSKEAGIKLDAPRFIDFYASKGWLVGKSKMRDWRAAARNWARSEGKDDGYNREVGVAKLKAIRQEAEKNG